MTLTCICIRVCGCTSGDAVLAGAAAVARSLTARPWRLDNLQMPYIYCISIFADLITPPHRSISSRRYFAVRLFRVLIDRFHLIGHYENPIVKGAQEFT